MDYPSAKKFISNDEIYDELEILASYQYTIVEESYFVSNMLSDRSIINGKQKLRATPNAQGMCVILETYNKMDDISSVFTGDVRSKCRRSDEKISPLEYWEKNWEKLVRIVGKDTEKLDNILWTKARGCGAFRPKLMAGAIEHFNAKSVLDFSSGWFDRLIGSMAKGVRYVGVDPNPELYKLTQSTIKTLADMLAINEDLYTMIKSPFQTAILPKNETFDLVFTSPPYFELELYATSIESSNLEVWKSLFLYPSLEKAWSYLNPKGYMCIVINDYGKNNKRIKYVNDMVRYVSTLPGAFNLNTQYKDSCVPYLAYAAKKGEGVTVDTFRSAQPMWTWQKTGTVPVRNVYNPTIIISQHTVNNGTVNVIRDDMLEGSTKQRALYNWLLSYGEYSEFVYAGPDNGHGQLSISIICQALGKKATLFLQSSTGKYTALVEKSIKYGAKVHLFAAPLRTVTQEAAMYVDRHPNSLLIPLGADTAEYHRLMVRAINASFPKNIEVKRMWITVGSGGLLKALSVVFPNTKFIAVRVGKAIHLEDYPDLLNRTNVSYDATEKYKFSQSVNESEAPPYPSSSTYDAKMWVYILNNAEDGDYVWNAASY